jgi:hypothetical protein
MKFSIRSFRWTDFLLPLQSGHGSIRKPPHFWQTLVTERDWKQKHQLQYKFKLIDYLEMGHLLESYLLEKPARHQNLDCSTASLEHVRHT